MMLKLFVALALIGSTLFFCYKKIVARYDLRSHAYRILTYSEYLSKKEYGRGIEYYEKTDHCGKRVCLQNISDLNNYSKERIDVLFNGKLIFSTKDFEKVIQPDFNERDVINVTVAIHFNDKVYLVGSKSTFFYSSDANSYYLFFVFNDNENSFYIIPSNSIIY